MSERDFLYQMGYDAAEEIYKPQLLSAKNKIEELLRNIETIDDCICNDREEEALMFISEILHKSVEEGLMEWSDIEEEEGNE